MEGVLASQEGASLTRDVLRFSEDETLTTDMVLQVQAKAQAMATALQTIGKFKVKKKAGAADSIFGRYGC